MPRAARATPPEEEDQDMAEVQTSYANELAIGFAGLIASGGNGDRITRTCESSGGIAFGKPAFRGSGDHGCVATQTLVGAGSEQAGNTGSATITDAPAIAADAKIGRHLFVQLSAGATGEVAGFDPDGIATGNGVVGTEFTLGGITATITSGGSPAVGDTYFVDVTGGAFLGIAIADQALAIVGGQSAGKYQQYDNVAILAGGEPIWVEAGGTVSDGAAVQFDGDYNFVAAGGAPCPGWVFDTSGADGGLVKIVKR
jgi:hypothetical protein